MIPVCAALGVGVVLAVAWSNVDIELESGHRCRRLLASARLTTIEECFEIEPVVREAPAVTFSAQ